MTYEKKLRRLKKKKRIIVLLKRLCANEDIWEIKETYPKYAEKIMRIMEAKQCA